MTSSSPGLALRTGARAAEGIGPELCRGVQDERSDRASIFDVAGATYGSGELLFRDRQSSASPSYQSSLISTHVPTGAIQWR